MRKRIGCFSAEVIDLLKMNISPGTPIYISDSNIQHMKISHPEDYSKYGSDISFIIATPDYVGLNIKDSSVEFTKEYKVNGEFVKVAVRISYTNVHYARSLYVLNNNRVHNFIQKGTLIPLDKHRK